MSVATIFNEIYYLDNNSDVATAVQKADFTSGFSHFVKFGGQELRAPNAFFDPEYYSLENPLVVDAVNQGAFVNVFQHYQLFGEMENRAPSIEFDGFSSESYLAENPDVLEAVLLGSFASALDHFISFGRQEERPGTGITAISFELTAQIDNLKGTAGDDIFFGRAEDFSIFDKLNGGGGFDTLEIIHTGKASVPNLLNSKNIEQLKITDIEHQTLDFSELSEIVSVVLNGGTTVKGRAIKTTLGAHQTLSLQNVKNADFSSSSLTNGGMIIDLPDTASSLDLKADRVGELSNAAHQIFLLDLMGESITHLNIENQNASSISLFNSGGALTDIELTGSGSISLNALPAKVTKLEAANSTADIELRTADVGTFVSTGSGNDKVRLGNGADHATTRDGHDTIIAGGGVNGISTGSGNDNVFILAGTNDVDTGPGDDGVTLQGGTNDLKTDNGSDVVSISSGENIVDAGSDDDTISIDGGDNSVFLGAGDDLVVISNGSSSINLGEGNDVIVVTSSVNLNNFAINGGNGIDSLQIVHNGSISLPGTATFSDVESIFVSNLQHQSLDFSSFAGVPKVILASGTTIDGGTIDITLGPNQYLMLNSIVDGDTSAASLADGGIKIKQDTSIVSLDLRLDDIGPNTSLANESVFLDIAGTSVSNATIKNKNTSFVNISNTGGALSKVNLEGSGILGISISTPAEVDATLISGALSLTGSSFGNVITGSIGDDTVILTGGTNRVDSGLGDDTVTLSAGTDTVNTGQGDDTIVASAGTNVVNSGTGNDQITVSGGVNEIDAGAGDDIVTASGGASNVNIRVLEGGLGSDTLRIISTGNVTLPTSTGFENIFISDTVHQSLDFSLSSNVEQIELDSGTTIDNDVITITLASDQSLLLTRVVDGDTSAASIDDGGIRISQDASITSLDLALDDVGPSSSVANENVFIDIGGVSVQNAKITSGNDSFVVLSNSGGALTGLELLGTGSMALGTLPNSVTNVNGTAASANLTLTIGNGSNTIRGGIGNDAITLTGGVNDVQTGDGDDTITTSTNLVPGDRIDGGNGNDTFEVIHTGLATVPSLSNLSSIERIAIQDTIHQTLDFSGLTTITGVELNSGTTVDNALIVTTLGDNQSLTLDSITDGDTGAASLSDGGIRISQSNSATSLNLTVDDIGPDSANTNTNVFIDISGTGIATANITSANDSFIVLENSGAALTALNLDGAGTLGILAALPNSIATINGTNSSANLTLTSGTSGSTITGGSGNDEITLTGGTNNVTSGDGNDTINLSTGADTVNTGSGNDIVVVAAGTNNISTGANNDQVTISGGTNTVITDTGSDTVTAAAGTNNITTGASSDQITLSGGNNTVNSGASNDQFTISGGTNNIDTESGNDQITISGGNNTIVTGNNNDVISASTGVNNIDTGSGNDQITLTGGTNTVVAGNNNDIVNASGGNNDIDTDAGGDQVVLTGGTNDVNTGADNDTVTLSGGTETVDMGSGDDTVEAAGNLSTSDTVNGGDGTGDTIEVTSALTDALTARLSNFEILEIKGGGGLTHDVTGLTGLTSLKVSGSLTGAVVITDLGEAAEVDISAAIGNDLTINQINSAGGADTLTFDFSGSNFTTGGSIITPNIETVTLKTTASGAKTITGATFADATNIIITATGSNLTINDLTATNITALNASSSNKIVTITTGADVFSSAFTYSGGSGNERLDFDGATLVANTVFELGQGQDTLTLNADGVATVVRTSATSSGNAFSIRDDATSTNTASFTSGSDTFDYNGSLSHDSVTSVVATSGATLQAAVAADADATVYVIQDADGDADLETAIDNFADNVGRGRANTLETEAVDTGLLSYTGLDAAFDSSDIVLIVIDTETNEDAIAANNGGTAVYRFQNSNTSTVDTVLSSELELIGVFQDAALGTVDFV